MAFLIVLDWDVIAYTFGDYKAEIWGRTTQI